MMFKLFEETSKEWESLRSQGKGIPSGALLCGHFINYLNGQIHHLNNQVHELHSQVHQRCDIMKPMRWVWEKNQEGIPLTTEEKRC